MKIFYVTFSIHCIIHAVSIILHVYVSSFLSRVDTRLYDELLSTVPQEALTVPLILYCMEEQVKCTTFLVYLCKLHVHYYICLRPDCKPGPL